MKRLKWVNIPIPPQHLVGLILGVILEYTFSPRLISFSWLGVISGFSFIFAGIWIIVISTLEAGEMEIEFPGKLITTGPYSFSRNPMYVGWHSIFISITIFGDSPFLFVILWIVILFTHNYDIKKEEKFLISEFGMLYHEYQKNVRRYI